MPPETPTEAPASVGDDGRIGRPQNRNGIGDVDLAFGRYESTRAELIALFRDQPWFQDGLSRDESLFVERSLSFVARYGQKGEGYVGDEIVRRNLRRIIGDDAFADTARDIYLDSDFGRRTLRDKRLEDAFLSHAPPVARDDVMALFNRVVWFDNGERYRQLQEQVQP